MDNQIKQNGHVAVYGIHFNTGQADILPDSEGTLTEIVKLMQQDATLNLRIEGHTDTQSNASANQALSEKRARSVVA
jgi:OmpA-OmpF porin, OOP family